MIEVIYRIDPTDQSAGRKPSTAEEARILLEEGNKAFASLLESDSADGEVVRRVIRVTAADLGLAGSGSEMLRHDPFALVVGCADARVPIELILSQGVNDLFVLRVAGNVLGEEIRGSIDYAFQNLPTLLLVVVLGHSRCGAVSAAVKSFLDPAAYLGLSANHELRSIVNQLFPAVRLSHASMIQAWGASAADHPGFAAGLVETSTVVNAALMAASLRHELASHGLTAVQPVFGVYDLGTRRIGVSGDFRLLDPPIDADGFTSLSVEVAAGPVVSQFMQR